MDYTPAPNIETTLTGLSLYDLRIDKGINDDQVHLHTWCSQQRERQFDLYHDQDCCECVRLHDVQGRVDLLMRSPLVEVKETIIEWRDGGEQPVAWPADIPRPSESGTVTLFTLTATNGVVVTIRWLGTSNGYYSESVSFVETTK